ncbi:MAG: DUF6046 domain-containing protein [Bacteroidales bacterium]|nr:DUF6046 domain-containing protein [Bacteroidales bacterium]
MYLEDKYNSFKNLDLSAYSANEQRKFSFLIENLLKGQIKTAIYKSVLKSLDGKSLKTSKFFGLPMWDNLILDTQDKKLAIDMVLIDVSMTKNIIKTQVAGMNGTIKEYISDGDYALNIQGAIFNDKNTNEYPEDDVSTLIEICNKPESIRVESKFLDFFEITDIVIENYKLSAKEATNNVQFFSINAVSDMPEELIFRK